MHWEFCAVYFHKKSNYLRLLSISELGRDSLTKSQFKLQGILHMCCHSLWLSQKACWYRYNQFSSPGVLKNVDTRLQVMIPPRRAQRCSIFFACVSIIILYLGCSFIAEHCLWLHVNTLHLVTTPHCSARLSVQSPSRLQHGITVIVVQRQAAFSGLQMDFISSLLNQQIESEHTVWSCLQLLTWTCPVCCFCETARSSFLLLCDNLAIVQSHRTGRQRWVKGC